MATPWEFSEQGGCDLRKMLRRGLDASTKLARVGLSWERRTLNVQHGTFHIERELI